MEECLPHLTRNSLTDVCECADTSHEEVDIAGYGLECLERCGSD
jgi:hypothetical protein|tara:strand:+ start:299 stop:430 length:132 start_codon:yes stop_codon:yes gene_type:complete